MGILYNSLESFSGFRYLKSEKPFTSILSNRVELVTMVTHIFLIYTC